MESSFSMGGLIPLWILGGPFLAALFALFTLPKRSRRDARDGRESRDPRDARLQAAHLPMPASGLSARRA